MTTTVAPAAPRHEMINSRYRVLRELGRGGMGCVYLVEDLCFKARPTALKTILPDAASSDFLDRFRVEFLNLSKLTHPSLTAAYDFGQITGTNEHFYTTAFVEGVDLLEGTEGATADQLVDVITQTLSGIEFLHSHGILHNDLKPANVLLERLPGGAPSTNPVDLTRLEAAVYGRVGRVKIIDFGLLSAEHTTWRKILGTPRYISPERILRTAADRRSDLYSLGMLFYVLCARSHPFAAEGGQSLLQMHLKVDPPSLAGHRPDLPRVIIDLVARLIRKDPNDRFDSAAAALEFLSGGLGWAQSASPSRSRSLELDPGSMMFRDSQLQLLVERFRQTAASASSSPGAVIQGPSGIGKSRLAGDFRSIVQVEGGAFIEVGGAAVRGHLLPVMERVLHGLETSGSPGLEALRELGGSRGAGGEIADLLERKLLEEAVRVPVVIHFDDFQDASSAVRRFVLELVHALCSVSVGECGKPRLMLLLSRRDGKADGALKAADLLAIELEPFSSEQAREFLERIFGREAIPPEPLRTLVSAAAGNPGLLLELAKYLVEQNHVRRSGTRWLFPATLAGISLPDGVGTALKERMGTLDKSSRDALEVICVACEPISLQVLASCLSMPEKRANQILERLGEKGLVAVQALDGSSAASRSGGELKRATRVYRVAHDGARIAVAERLTVEQKRSLHQSLARAFEAAPEDSPYQGERLHEILAFHWREAGNLPGFLRFAPLAAQTLQRCGDLERAIDYHRQLSNALPLDATASKVQSLVRLAEMHEVLWDVGQSRMDLQAILDMGSGLLKPEDRAMTLRRIATLEIARNDNPAALSALDAAKKALPRPPDAVLGIALDGPEAWASWFSGDRERSRAALARAERVLAEVVPRDVRQKGLIAGSALLLATLHQSVGRLSRAEALYRVILSLASDPNLLQAEGAAHAAYGGLLLDAGRPQEALAHLEAALKTAKRIGDRRTLCRTRERLSEHHLLHGELKTAFQAIELGLEAAAAVRHAAASASCLKTLGRIYLRAGLTDDASGALEKALALNQSANDFIGATFARLYLARARIAQGRLEEAVKEAEVAGVEAQRFDLTMASGLALLLSAEAQFLKSRSIDLQALREAATLFQSSGYMGLLCEARLLEARGTIDAGDAAKGLQTISEIEDLLQAAGSQEQRLLARYLRALGGALGDVDDGVDHIQALQDFARGGLPLQVAEECRAALRRISTEEATSCLRLDQS